MWISPLILCALTAWVIYANGLMNPSPLPQVAVSLLIGVVLGIPFGILRGAHTDVRLTDRPGVMYLGSSWATLAVYIAAFGLRYAVRIMMPQHGSLSGAVGDALLAFATAFVATSYFIIFRKYEAELAGKIAAPRAPPVP